MKHCAVFSTKGLGDGLIASVLANNLQINGATVTFFHPFLQGLQRWFPHLAIRPFPTTQELVQFDAFFFIYEQTPWMQALLKHCEKLYPDQTAVLNPIATKNKDYAYYGVGKFEGDRTFVDNILSFCRESLCLKLLTKSNGIQVPESCHAPRRHNRVILHPTSSREGKNWPKEKFIGLAELLVKRGYEPLFVLTKEEGVHWHAANTLCYGNLEELASCVASSGYMIGNDSGIGHLASCLGLPTVTICRSHKAAKFWRPAWARGTVVAPPWWIPNIKLWRLRDKEWKRWVSVHQVFKSFEKGIGK